MHVNGLRIDAAVLVLAILDYVRFDQQGPGKTASELSQALREGLGFSEDDCSLASSKIRFSYDSDNGFMIDCDDLVELITEL